MKYDTQKAYLASYVIYRRDNKVAFVLRSNTNWMNNYYGLPSGKVESGETFTQAAIREAKEETGVQLLPENLKYVHTVHRMDKDSWVDVCFEVINCKQEPINNEPHLHSELVWLDIDNLPKNVIPAVRDMIENIKKDNKFSEFGWKKYS